MDRERAIESDRACTREWESEYKIVGEPTFNKCLLVTSTSDRCHSFESFPYTWETGWKINIHATMTNAKKPLTDEKKVEREREHAMKLWIFPKKSFDFRSVHWSHLFLFVRFKKPPKLNCAEVKRCFQLYFQCDFKLDAQRVCMNTHAYTVLATRYYSCRFIWSDSLLSRPWIIC